MHRGIQFWAIRRKVQENWILRVKLYVLALRLGSMLWEFQCVWVPAKRLHGCGWSSTYSTADIECIILHWCPHCFPERRSAAGWLSLFPQLTAQWFELPRQTCPALWNRIAPATWDLFGAKRRKCLQHWPRNTSQRHRQSHFAYPRQIILTLQFHNHEQTFHSHSVT